MQKNAPLPDNQFVGLCRLLTDCPELKVRFYSDFLNQEFYLLGRRGFKSFTFELTKLKASDVISANSDLILNIFTDANLARDYLISGADDRKKLSVFKFKGQLIRDIGLSVGPENVHLAIKYSATEPAVVIDNTTLRLLNNQDQSEKARYGAENLMPIDLTSDCCLLLKKIFKTNPKIESVAVCDTTGQGHNPLFIILSSNDSPEPAILYQPIKETLADYGYLCQRIKFSVLTNPSEEQMGLFYKACMLGTRLY